MAVTKLYYGDTPLNMAATKIDDNSVSGTTTWSSEKLKQMSDASEAEVTTLKANMFGNGTAVWREAASTYTGTFYRKLVAVDGASDYRAFVYATLSDSTLKNTQLIEGDTLVLTQDELDPTDYQDGSETQTYLALSASVSLADDTSFASVAVNAYRLYDSDGNPVDVASFFSNTTATTYTLTVTANGITVVEGEASAADVTASDESVIAVSLSNYPSVTTLMEGAKFRVVFSNDYDYDGQPDMAVNGGTSYPVTVGNVAAGIGAFQSGKSYEFVFTGTSYDCLSSPVLELDYDNSVTIKSGTAVQETTYTCTKNGEIIYNLNAWNGVSAYIKLNGYLLAWSNANSQVLNIINGQIKVKIGDVLTYKDAMNDNDYVKSFINLVPYK